MVCMSAGFAMVIPGSWTSRNNLRLEAWLSPHYNTLFLNYTRCQQCHLSWSWRLYATGQESRLDVFLSKAQLSEQLHSHLSDDVPAAPPEIKRRTYICKTTRKDMHIHVALRALERCMDVVRLLCIRSGIIFEGLISHCRHSSLTWLAKSYPLYPMQRTSSGPSRNLSRGGLSFIKNSKN